MKMNDWLPISTAKKDENSPILVWYDHSQDTYTDASNPSRLTDYAAIAEGGDLLFGNGVVIAVWRSGYHENDGPESESYWIPGGWFIWMGDDAGDQVVNAIFWMPLPDAPQ
jgi:hypothetical protein